VLRSRERDDLATRLAEAQSRIAELESELANRAGRDTLSQTLLTLRNFRSQLAVDVHRARRYGSPLSVALIDIDRFRQVNTRHGFAAGDEVLIAFSQMVAERMQINDLACHAGGDEFGVMLPETDAEAASEAMQCLLVELEDLEQVSRVDGELAGVGGDLREPQELAFVGLADCLGVVHRHAWRDVPEVALQHVDGDARVEQARRPGVAEAVHLAEVDRPTLAVADVGTLAELAQALAE